MKNILETLSAELERRRELSPRVLNYIGDTHQVEHDKIGDFLVEQLPKLEDYEVDLVLSPAFTPKLADQAIFAELLGREPIKREEWPNLIQQLEKRPTRAQLVTLDSQVHSIQLREVTIERYVHRLRLEATIPQKIFGLIEQLPAPDRPLLKAIARRSVWESAGPMGILERYLAVALKKGQYGLADALALLELAEGRKPANLAGLIADIPRWREALRVQIEGGSAPKPFFNQDVERMHGGGRDQRRPDDPRLSAKESEFEFLGRLEKML